MKPTLSNSIGQNSDLDIVANYQQIRRSGEHMHVPDSKCIFNHGKVPIFHLKLTALTPSN